MQYKQMKHGIANPVRSNIVSEKEPKTQLGKELRSQRKRAGLQQNQIPGLKSALVHRLEAGQIPTEEQIAQLSDAMNLPEETVVFLTNLAATERTTRSNNRKPPNEKPVPTELGTIIRTARKSANLTQKDLPGFTEGQIKVYESGVTIPTRATVDALGAALDLPNETVASLKELAMKERREKKKKKTPPEETIVFIDSIAPLDPTRHYPDEDLVYRTPGEVSTYLRERYGWTRRETAHAAGIDPTQLIRIETGNTQISSKKTLQKLKYVYYLPEDTKIFEYKSIPRTKKVAIDVDDETLNQAPERERIKLLREGQGVSREALAKELGDKGIGVIRGWDKGLRPSKKDMIKLTKIFGMSYEDLAKMYDPSPGELAEMDFAQYMAYQRTVEGISQSELAKRTGRNRALIIQIEAGHIPNIVVAKELMAAFGWDDQDPEAIHFRQKYTKGRIHR